LSCSEYTDDAGAASRGQPSDGREPALRTLDRVEQWQAPDGMTVLLDGVVRRRITPGCVLTFGRAPEAPEHLHVGPPGHDECHLSRVAGALRHRDRLWMITNESRYIPFEVAIEGVVYQLAPSGMGQIRALPVLADTVVRLTTPAHVYEIELRPVAGEAESRWSRPLASGPDTSPPIVEPSPHERRLLAAKFLSRRTPGDAIGDKLATRRAAEAAGQEIAPRAVDNCVRRWKDRLRDQGWHGLDGRSNIDRVGRLLLSYGVLRLSDRLPLPPVEDDDPGIG
jgi:hypothetical protein